MTDYILYAIIFNEVIHNFGYIPNDKEENMKKILCLLLILMVVVSSFVACGCNNNSGDPIDTGSGSGDQSQIETGSGGGNNLIPDDDQDVPDKKEDFVLPEGVNDNIENDNEIKVN